MPSPDLSLCIGVTGHRDIDPAALPKVEALVREALDQLAAEFGLGMILFSSLAEGGDRLVARIALERGARLVVPMPAPVQQYESDFVTADSKSEFRGLLAIAENTFVVEDDNVDEEPVEAGALPHIAGYRRAGLFVARSCHVLLALWDGVQPGSPAGTWEIVQAKRAGESPLGRPDLARAEIKEPRGVVVQVRVPRAGDAHKIQPALIWPSRLSRAWKGLGTTCELTKRFNVDAAGLHVDISALIEKSSSAGRMRRHPASAPPSVDRLIQLYAVADRLAVANQKHVRHSWIALYAAAVVAVFAYGFYAHTERHHWSILAGYLVVIGLGFLGYFYVYKQSWHDRFLDYRGLAEGLRVAFFWRVAGLAGDPVDRYPANLAGEVEWVRLILRTETARGEPANPEASRTPEALAFAEREWVEVQADYFKTAGAAHSHSAERAKRYTNWLIGAGIALAAALVATQLLDEESLHLGWHQVLFYGALVAIAVVPAVGAAIAGYSDRLGHETQARQYERMAQLFDHALMVLKSLQRAEDRRLVLSRLASEALAEHAQWVALHRERPFEFVSGGG